MNRKDLRSRRQAEALDDTTTTPSKSNGSKAAQRHKSVFHSADSPPVQPADIKQVVYFLSFTLKESILQTGFTAQQSLKCTWLLVRELPKPYIDSVRILVPLWLTVFHAFFLVILALTQRFASDGLHRAHRFIASLAERQKRWTSIRVPPAFQLLASRSGAVLSSAAPSAPPDIEPGLVALAPSGTFGGLNANAKIPSCTVDEVRKEAFACPVTSAVKQLEDSTSHRPLPKSRTLHVFSSISDSFSRSALLPSLRINNSSTTSLGSDTGTTTVTSSTTIATAIKAPLPTRVSASKSSRWSIGSHKSPLEISLSRDPYIIYEAQPSAYWTGRFMSLHDKFQSEALTPKNMQSLILAHAHRATTNKLQHMRGRQRDLFQDVRYSRYHTRLPQSATSSAVLQQTGGDVADAIAHSNATLLLDEDERCRRVFVHLEAFCATNEARKSLHLWQQDYARKTGRKKLLPKGGAMEERHGGSYISRIMGGKRIGKRASVM